MIICFSGTGNSLQVAETLAPLIDDNVTLLSDLKEITGNRVVWVCPIYSWGIPPVVLDTIKALPDQTGREHHLVATCGDDCGLADRMFRDAIAERGAQSGVVATVIMPNNYVALPGFDVDSPETARCKLDAMPERVAAIARMILNDDTQTDVTHGSMAWIKTRIIYPWFVRNEMSPKRFHSTDACIGCGICSLTCPLGNIDMVNGSSHQVPCWGDNCAACFRCYHICPHHAIGYGKSTKSKKQYVNPTLMENLKKLNKIK